MRPTRLALLAGIAGLLIPVAASTSASAVDQDLQVSAVAGPARSEITVTSASCPTDNGPKSDSIGLLRARLISGTAPGEVLAGFGNGFLGTDATIVVPDWVDPDQPAVIEAQCTILTIDGDEIIQTTFEYDPVAFDVEPSGEPPVQARTFSRTSLAAGQAFAVDATGCFLDNAAIGVVEVAAGSDLAARDLVDLVGMGEADMDGDTFQALTAMSNGGVDISDRDDGGVDIVEIPTDIPPGEYTALPFCSSEDATLMFEPAIITVTGDAPFADNDLTIPAESRTATLAGSSCTADSVAVEMDAYDFGEVEPLGLDPLADRITQLGPSPLPAAGYADALETVPATKGRTAADALARGAHRSGTSSRGFDPDGYLEAETTPVDGNWSVAADVAFNRGFVEGYAVCGDPLADGFIYDPQAAEVSATETTSTTSSTTSTTAPTPAPAPAIAGTPTYAG
jgi:hypothetical protein